MLHKQIYVVIDLAALVLVFAVLLIVVTRSTQSTATCIDHSLTWLSQARESTGASRYSSATPKAENNLSWVLLSILGPWHLLLLHCSLLRWKIVGLHIELRRFLGLDSIGAWSNSQSDGGCYLDLALWVWGSNNTQSWWFLPKHYHRGGCSRLGRQDWLLIYDGSATTVNWNPIAIRDLIRWRHEMRSHLKLRSTAKIKLIGGVLQLLMLMMIDVIWNNATVLYWIYYCWVDNF